jgi:calcineurin-like phosphoesterase
MAPEQFDGRATAVLGTHTHVQTSDARVLAGGTAAITDAGMTGPHDSVIGSNPAGPIRRFLTGFPERLEVAEGDVRIEGALVECDANGRATSCAAIRVPVEGV